MLGVSPRTAPRISRMREQADKLPRLPGTALRRGDQTAFPHKLMSTTQPVNSVFNLFDVLLQTYL